ncbi:unnamed protein product [Diamesa serratosioi]
MAADRLKTIQPFDWFELRDLFVVNWPENHVAYHTIDNFLQWHRKEEEDIKNLKIYSLNDSWRSDGTYVIVDRYQLFVYTLEISNDKLKRLLSLLDWSGGFKVSSFLKRHRSAVVDVVEHKKLKLEYDSLTFLYFMSKEEAKSIVLSAPSDITLKQLSVSDAELVNDEWPNKHEGSLFLIKRLIEWNTNIGAYNEDGELMGWCLRLQSGPLGALQVRDKFKRLGIGSLVTIAMSKMLSHADKNTFALVGEQNIPSRTMFEKLNFKHTDDAYWLRTLPTNETTNWINE